MRHAIWIILLAFLAACSEHSRPDNPEPTIVIDGATDVTRSEAIVRAHIDRHGGSPLSYVRLLCREVPTGASDSRVLEGDPYADTYEFKITGLHPGVRYSCHLEAGTATAFLKSDSISFTTIPNDPPKVTGLTPLSTGPLGMMVRFEIIDNGGESIVEAGCEIKQDGSMESRRIYASGTGESPAEVRLTINGLTPTTTYRITPFATNAFGSAYGETLEYTTKEAVVLTEPGVLATIFDSEGTTEMPGITIAGPMDGDDFRTLRAMLGAPGHSDSSLHISDIDLTDVSILEGGGSYDGQHFTAANRVSSGLLAACSTLRTVLLPASAIAIDRDALARCHALELLTVPASVENIMPSSDCPVLKAIEVSKANSHFISDQGVLLNSSATEIIWFPCGKTGEYHFPSTISTIGENAFASTSITTLIIPSTVTVISRGAFAGSSLREIRLPDNMTNISEGMFQNCSSLTTVRLGTATDFIGDYAFDRTDLTDLYVGADYPPYTAPEAFTNRQKALAEECILHVPTGTGRLYRSHAKWGAFKTIEEFQP